MIKKSISDDDLSRELKEKWKPGGGGIMDRETGSEARGSSCPF